jgi:hypothetical protein
LVVIPIELTEVVIVGLLGTVIETVISFEFLAWPKALRFSGDLLDILTALGNFD